ncbi:MAG: hypothetical protein NC489_38385 [Ruminococcus flavefaciens]|nr:hypothetical protein [Ruminococcus flavefaciens]
MRGRTNVGGGGSNSVILNGDTQQFQIAENNSIAAGDFVELTGNTTDFNALEVSTNYLQAFLDAGNGITINAQCKKTKNITFVVLHRGEEIGRYDFDVFDFSSILSMHVQMVDSTIYVSWIYPSSSSKITSHSILLFDFDKNNNQITYKRTSELDFSTVNQEIKDRDTICGKIKIHNGKAYVLYHSATTISSNNYAYRGNTYLLIYDIDGEELVYNKYSIIRENYTVYMEKCHIYIDGYIFIINTSEQTSGADTCSPYIAVCDADGNFLNLTFVYNSANLVGNHIGIYYDNDNLFILDGLDGKITVYDVQTDGKIYSLSSITLKSGTYSLSANGLKLILKNGQDYYFLIYGLRRGNSLFMRGTRIVRYDSRTLTFSDEYEYPQENMQGISSGYWYSNVEEQQDGSYIQYFSIPTGSTSSIRMAMYSQSFSINNNIVVLSEELNLIKNWNGTINGVALQSGKGGDVVEVSVPKQK